MKQIEAFVDSVYLNVGGNRKEIQELKSEMENHLLESVLDLKLQGKTEQEAIEIAIERFGGKKEILSVVNQLFKVQKTFAKRLLFVGLAILLLTTTVSGYFINIGNERTSEQAEIAYKIGKIVENGGVVTQPTEEKIKHLPTYIKKVTVYLNGDRNKPIYKFGSNTNQTFPLIFSDFSYGNGNSFVEIEVLDYREIGIYSLFFGITCSGVLFIIWAIINISHRKKKQFFKL
jgi:hypothetical protein